MRILDMQTSRMKTTIDQLTICERSDLADYLAGYISDRSTWDTIMQECVGINHKLRQRYDNISAGCSPNASHKKIINAWVEIISKRKMNIAIFCDVFRKHGLLNNDILEFLGMPTEAETRKIINNPQSQVNDTQITDTEIKKLEARVKELEAENASQKQMIKVLTINSAYEKQQWQKQYAELQKQTDDLRIAANRNASLGAFRGCPRLDTADTREITYNGLTITIPKRHPDHEGVWNNLTPRQHKIIATNIAPELDDILMHFNLNADHIRSNLSFGSTLKDCAIYFVNMMNEIGYLDSIQDAILQEIPGIMATINKEL